jgi:hypothetical protein
MEMGGKEGADRGDAGEMGDFKPDGFGGPSLDVGGEGVGVVVLVCNLRVGRRDGRAGIPDTLELSVDCFGSGSCILVRLTRRAGFGAGAVSGQPNTIKVTRSTSS